MASYYDHDTVTMIVTMNSTIPAISSDALAEFWVFPFEMLTVVVPYFISIPVLWMFADIFTMLCNRCPGNMILFEEHLRRIFTLVILAYILIVHTVVITSPTFFNAQTSMPFHLLFLSSLLGIATLLFGMWAVIAVAKLMMQFMGRFPPEYVDSTVRGHTDEQTRGAYFTVETEEKDLDLLEILSEKASNLV